MKVIQCEYCQQYFEYEEGLCCTHCVGWDATEPSGPNEVCEYCGKETYNRYGCKRCKEKRLHHLVDDYLMLGE